MLKRVLKVFLVIIIALCLLLAAAVTVANAFLPEKIRSSAVTAIKNSTGADCRIASVRFHFFKGLVARDIAVSKEGNPLFSVEEISLRPDPLAIFSGKLIISSLTIIRPSARFERWSREGPGPAQFIPRPGGGGNLPFPLIVNHISIQKGEIAFVDHTVEPAFARTITGLNVNAWLSLPPSVKFTFEAAVENSPMTMGAIGQLDLSSASFTCRANVKGLTAADILPYWPGRAVALNNGRADTDIAIEFKEGVLKLRAVSRVSKAEFSAGKVKAAFDSTVTFKMGQAFSAPPVFTLECVIDRGTIDFGGFPGVLAVSGPLELSKSALAWKGFKVSRGEQSYITAGTLKNFSSPEIDFNAFDGNNLQIEGLAKTENNVLTISYLKATTPASTVSLTGTLDFGSKELNAGLSSLFDLELSDLDTFFKHTKSWEQAKPSGKVSGQAKFTGSLSNIPHASASCGFKSGPLSAYGLKAGSSFADYKQEAGRAKLLFNFSAYDGLMNNEADIDLTAPGLPFQFKTKFEGLKLEQLKNDTVLKNKDLAGSLTGQAEFTGSLNSIKDSSGQGTIDMSKGKLLQLDVLAGLGQLLFPELGMITFDYGHAGFTVKDRKVNTNDFALTSRTLALAGKGSLGFDGSVDAFMELQVSDMIIPTLGHLRQIAGMVLKQTGKIVGVKITGTRRQPKYSVEQPIVMDIWKKLKGLLNLMGNKATPG